MDFAVDVYWKPKFRDLNPDVRVIEKDRTTLECKVDAKPQAEIQWLKAGRPLDVNAPNVILSPRGEHLMILNSKRTDAGSYSCVAKNAAGESEGSFIVTVLGMHFLIDMMHFHCSNSISLISVPPHIDAQIDQNPKVVSSMSVVIACPVLGIPKPKVRHMVVFVCWALYDKVVPSHFRFCGAKMVGH